MFKIAVIGLGYVGLPLALEFSKKYSVLGFDLNIKRINQLKKKIDRNNDINKKDFKFSKNLKFSYKIDDLKTYNTYIIAVPTPINRYKQPDKKNLFSACKFVGMNLSKDDLVIFESTVYPGLTEDECVPILEKISKLKFNFDFFCGYSPERMNPGDQNKKIGNIVKLTSGSNYTTSLKVDKLYKSIIKAGTYRTSNIKIAEAAKVIENAQRDLNIAFVNELAKIFYKMNLDTNEILEAAGTKWNFLKFKPGLVGGHCIGIDPYYITYKSKLVGYDPKIILSGRSVNDSMPHFIVKKLFYNMKKRKIAINNSKILVMGITFKENCSDMRNSKIFDIINILNKKNIKSDIYDPLIKREQLINYINYNFVKLPKKKYYDAIIIAVAHKKFVKEGKKNIISFSKKKNIIFDLKNIFPNEKSFLKI